MLLVVLIFNTEKGKNSRKSHSGVFKTEDFLDFYSVQTLCRFSMLLFAEIVKNCFSKRNYKNVEDLSEGERRVILFFLSFLHLFLHQIKFTDQ